MRSDTIENLRLLHEPKVLKRGFFAFLNVGTNYFTWVANEKTVRNCGEPFAVDFRQKMMRHLLLRENRRSIRDGADQALNDRSPVGFAGGDHFSCTGMLYASRLQIIGVKRLINYHGIVSTSPGAHHGGRDVARPGPHGDADAHAEQLSGGTMHATPSCVRQVDRLLWRRCLLAALAQVAKLGLGKNANQWTARWSL